MLAGSEDDTARRRPFDFFANIFKRRRDHEPPGEPHPHHHPPDITLQGPDALSESWLRDHHAPTTRNESLEVAALTPSPESSLLNADMMTSSESVTSSSGSLVHHTPVKARDIGVDMEQIRLSRQDNPYLQKVAGSQATLNEEEDVVDSGSSSQPEDTTQLVAQRSVSEESALSLSEVHEHLIRSPPPTTMPKAQAKNVFVFPLAKNNLDNNASPQSVPGRAHSLNPLVTRDHVDVLDKHLRQILKTQRKLVVNQGREGDPATTCSSVPGSPAHARALARRSPHARTLSEEAATVQGMGGVNVAGGVASGVAMASSVGVGITGGTGIGSTGGGGGGGGGGSVVGSGGSGGGGSGGGGGGGGSLAPVIPPKRRLHSPANDLLLNPAHPPISTGPPTPTPAVLKPISTKSKRSPGLRLEGVGPSASTTVSSLSLPIRYPHQPATSTHLVDIT